jgi:hypothetical protein
VTTLPPSYADFLEILEPQHTGTLWANNGIALPFTTVIKKTTSLKGTNTTDSQFRYTGENKLCK